MPKLWGRFPAPLRGVLSLGFILVNTIVWSVLLFLIALLKALVPHQGWRGFWGRAANDVAQRWVGGNGMGLDLTKDIRWDVEGIEGLSADRWYLLVCNHQTMVDIVVLQKVFHRKIPFLKFFLKQELFWVPVLGLAWWALDYPFMKRSSSGRRDLETARQACEKFKLSPVTVMNFVEGTRFTPAKHQEQSSPYKHLLKPKVGGIAVTLGTMGGLLDKILDVTIVYPRGVVGLWTFLCGSSCDITVRVRQLPVTADLQGDFLSDRGFRRRFVDWLNGVWEEKDRTIGAILERARAESTEPL
ncbi:MAG: acyltransferase [Syntrophobacteraceae bacterium]|jgi:1-acyl-sn-glycerol-3-phosphate acyltransferase|nr:acyltransferase [Syntrophobacteraceae bacterium]